MGVTHGCDHAKRMSEPPELQQAPCLSTTPVLQQKVASEALLLRGSVLLQGPREMAHVGPANPWAHLQVALALSQVPAPMQSLSLEQPVPLHSCSVCGAVSPLLRHACRHVPEVER